VKDSASVQKVLEDVAKFLRQIGEGEYCSPAAAPGADQQASDPEAVYQEALAESSATVSFALVDRDTLLAPLRTLSFWAMKDRARRFGELAIPAAQGFYCVAGGITHL
jgi:hypothetical protein